VNSAVTGSTVGFLVCAAIFLLGAGLWTIVPAVYGLPTVPARKERVRAALRLAGLKPGETIFDLSAGDGRVLVMAAREFGARAVGIEVGPIQCLLLWLRMQAEGLRDKVESHWGDFFRADLHQADVVFAYVTRAQVRRLRELAAREMRPATRLVMLTNELEGWKPAAVDRDALVFLYEVPFA
jgi:hypothetical protein